MQTLKPFTLGCQNRKHNSKAHKKHAWIAEQKYTWKTQQCKHTDIHKWIYMYINIWERLKKKIPVCMWSSSFRYQKCMLNLALTYCLDNICTFLLFTKRSQVLLLHSRVVRLPVSVMQSWWNYEIQWGSLRDTMKEQWKIKLHWVTEKGNCLMLSAGNCKFSLFVYPTSTFFWVIAFLTY